MRGRAIPSRHSSHKLAVEADHGTMQCDDVDSTLLCTLLGPTECFLMLNFDLTLPPPGFSRLQCALHFASTPAAPTGPRTSDLSDLWTETLDNLLLLQKCWPDFYSIDMERRPHAIDSPCPEHDRSHGRGKHLGPEVQGLVYISLASAQKRATLPNEYHLSHCLGLLYI